MYVHMYVHMYVQMYVQCELEKINTQKQMSDSDCIFLVFSTEK
jgi:hypothetical protein